MAKLFLLGATGYIGGDVLCTLVNTYPDLQITTLARNSDKGVKVASQYSKVKLVYGDTNDTTLLQTEASKADVVVDCIRVGEDSTRALLEGLANKLDGKPGYLIHTSGAGILAVADLERKTYGVKIHKQFDDWDGVKEVLDLPAIPGVPAAWKLVSKASEQYLGKVFTAIVCPPAIYGEGRGPDNQHSIQAPSLARATLSRGKGFQVGEGQSVWGEVHIQDLSNVYLGLVEAALQPGGGKATWGAEGFYFAESGEFAWGDISRAVAKIAQGKKFIGTAEVDSISADETNKLIPHGAYLLGTTARGKAVRARRVLGWKPVQKLLEQTLPDVVEREARELKITHGHAEKAAGVV